MEAVHPPGRSCPLGYRYPAAAVGAGAPLRADTLWIAGGLYGNPFALASLLALYGAESGAKALVFNGDFHWFDVGRDDFRAVNDSVLRFTALRGNVETELADPAEGAGCGCAYPEWVGDATVEHSNRIIARLRATAQLEPEALPALRALPMYLSAKVGDARIGIVHGDANSLAGWGLSQETLATAEGAAAAQASLARAGVDVLASSHTCLPVLQCFADGGVVVNNGSAGMPNFASTAFGLATRLSLFPHADALYRARRGELCVEAIPIPYDSRHWREWFLEHWPPGSAAYQSYWGRITGGPAYEPRRALRYYRSAPP